MLTSCEIVEGQTLEQKVEAITANKEPIKDGAPEIYTDRKDGVIAAYNIRSDRFEIAAEAMDKVSANRAAQREARMNPEKKDDKKLEKVIKMDTEKPTEGGKESGA